MNMLVEALAFAQSLEGASSVNDVQTRLLDLSKTFGLDRVIAGTLSGPKGRSSVQSENIIFAEWPLEWTARYVEQNYSDIDPVVRKIRTAPGHSVTWMKSNPLRDDSLKRKQMIREQHESGLIAGHAISSPKPGGELAVISFGGRELDLSPDVSVFLDLIGILALKRAEGLKSHQNLSTLIKLSTREIDVLRWSSFGKTASEISEIISISHRTVEDHISSAILKLGTTNKTHAVAEAIRAGIIA